jgi:AcrR family transcriptional regulator
MATSVRSPYPVAARELLRETLLDAALDEVRRRPWSEVTMADVARAAGVSRQTLYKEFGSRDAFVGSLALREADRFLAAVEEAVRENLDDPARALAAAFDVFTEAAAANPLVDAVFRGGSDELLELVTTRGKPLIDHAVERLAAVMRSGWSRAGEQDCSLLSECLVRLGISYMTLPDDRSRMTGDSIATVFGPYIERILRA